MKRNNKKGFTIVELVIVIAVIAILAAVLIPTFSNVIKKANMSADQQEIRNINTLIKTENLDGDFGIVDALGVLYSNNKNVITRDTDHTYVWNKKAQEFEYKLRSEISSLGEDYEEMTFASSIADVQAACENGGVVYLDSNLVLETAVDSLSVKKNLVLVGGSNNLVLSNCNNAMFSVDEENVNFGVFGLKILGKGTDATAAAIRVAAQNANVDVCNCDISGCKYLIDVKNYANLGFIAASSTNTYDSTNPYKGNSDRSVLADDATCSLTIKNSKLSGYGCINWKYVGGECLIENSTLYNLTEDWSLIVVEGNGAHIKVNDSTLLSGEYVSTACFQCYSKDCTLEFNNCTASGNGITNDDAMKEFMNDYDDEWTEDTYKISGKVGGVLMDLSGGFWSAQTGNKLIVDGVTIFEN